MYLGPLHVSVLDWTAQCGCMRSLRISLSTNWHNLSYVESLNFKSGSSLPPIGGGRKGSIVYQTTYNFAGCRRTRHMFIHTARVGGVSLLWTTNNIILTSLASSSGQSGRRETGLTCLENVYDRLNIIPHPFSYHSSYLFYCTISVCSHCLCSLVVSV